MTVTGRPSCTRRAGKDRAGGQPEREHGGRAQYRTIAHAGAGQDDRTRSDVRVFAHIHRHGVRTVAPIARRTMKVVVHDLAEGSDAGPRTDPDGPRRFQGRAVFDESTAVDDDLASLVSVQLNRRTTPEQPRTVPDANATGTREPDAPLDPHVAAELQTPCGAQGAEPPEPKNQAARRIRDQRDNPVAQSTRWCKFASTQHAESPASRVGGRGLQFAGQGANARRAELVRGGTRDALHTHSQP